MSQRSDIGALVKDLTDRMDKTKSERSQLQQQIDSMEVELRQVQEEIAEVTKQNDQVSGKLKLFLPLLVVMTGVGCVHR